MRVNDQSNEIMGWLWPLLSSAAGSITALASRPFKLMSRTEIMLALFVGASFAYFAGPWVVQMIFGHQPTDQHIVGGIYYVMATASNILLPFLIRKVSATLGYRDEEPKP